MTHIKWNQIISIFLLLLNILLLLIYLVTPINIDVVVSQYMITLEDSPVYYLAFWVTKLGSSTFLIPFTIFIMISFVYVYRQFKQALTISLATLSSYLLNVLLKMIFKRDRPSLFIEAHATGYSFPSGHAMIPLVFYGLLLYYINQKIESPIIRYILFIFIINLILVIGFSRVILNVHYISDVLIGFLSGLILLQIAIALDKK